MFQPVQLQARIEVAQYRRSRFEGHFLFAAVLLKKLSAEVIGERFEVVVQRREGLAVCIKVNETGPVGGAIHCLDVEPFILQNVQKRVCDPFFQQIQVFARLTVLVGGFREHRAFFKNDAVVLVEDEALFVGLADVEEEDVVHLF